MSLISCLGEKWEKERQGWSVGFYGISTFVYAYNQFYFKQFSLAVHSLIVKNISISNYSAYSNSSNLAISV